MRIDSSGGLHIGTDSAGSYPKTGHSIRGGDSAVFARTGSTGETMQIRRDNSTGEQIRFYRGASTINGAIGDGGGALYIRGNTHGIMFNGSSIEPVGNASVGSRVSNTVDIGAASYRFKDLYLSGGIDFGGAVNSGGTVSSSNKLYDYEEGTWTPELRLIVGGSATYSQRTAWYTKTGRMVTVHCIIFNTAHSGNGTAYIHGLPFVSSNESVGEAQINGHSASFSSSLCNVSSVVQGGESAMHIRATYHDTTSGPFYVPLQNFTYLRITLTYKTNS
jgi:hypothetical protein